MLPMIDLPGKAIQDFYCSKSRKKLFIHDTFGPKVEMPLSYYFRNFGAMPELERLALKHCHGKVLDIGAAAGSHALELQQRGIDVVALEISPAATQVMKDRGVLQVVNEDFFSFSGQRFDTLLLMMNGVGICSTLQGFREFLKKCRSVLSSDGQIIFDSCDVSYMYEEGELPANHYFGEIEFKYQYGTSMTDWFKWLYMDIATMRKIADEEGFASSIVFTDEDHQYLAVLRVKN
ncbi:MAG: class I SAM-dependent methyltransferase [Chryseobacterium sp.]|nr:class I SAM-dependent methyltransferase [Chryseobacterium sp.]